MKFWILSKLPQLIWDKLHVPKSLNEFGLTKEKKITFIKDTMDLKGALDQNPIPFYETEIEQVLDKLIL